MNNPGTILKLWNKAIKTHEGDKDPKALPKKGQDQKLRIKKSLTALKLQSGKLRSEDGRARFALLRDKAGLLMTKYCRYLKGSKDEDKKLLPRFLKTVKRLTVVVINLDPGNVSDEEEDAGLDSLDGVDDAALDARLEAPDVEVEDVEDEVEDLDEDEDEAEGAEEPDDEAPEDDPNALRWEERSAELEPLMLDALKSGRGDASKIRAVWAFATEKAGAGDHAKALLALDNLEKLLPSGDDKGPDDAARFAEMLKRLLPRIQAAIAAKDPGAQEAKLKASEAGVFGRKKEFAKAIDLLEEAEQLLEGGTEDEGIDEFEDMYYSLLETLNDDLPQLQRDRPSVAATVEQIMASAARHADNGDFQKAYTFLDRATTAVAKAAGAERVQEAAREIPEGKVAEVKAAFEQARVRWDGAIAAARSSLKPIEAELQGEYPKAITGLKTILDSYWQDLYAALAAGQALEDRGELGAAVTATLTRVKTLKAEVAGDQLFTYLAACGVPVKSSLTAAFDAVEGMLRG